MTKEDQLLVAKAALAGVRFWQLPSRFWASSYSPTGSGMFTIGRAAAYALHGMGLMHDAEWGEYKRRTERSGPVNVNTATLALELTHD